MNLTGSILSAIIMHNLPYFGHFTRIFRQILPKSGLCAPNPNRRTHSWLFSGSSRWFTAKIRLRWFVRCGGDAVIVAFRLTPFFTGGSHTFGYVEDTSLNLRHLDQERCRRSQAGWKAGFVVTVILKSITAVCITGAYDQRLSSMPGFFWTDTTSSPNRNDRLLSM